jgi:hypothetical protein
LLLLFYLYLCKFIYASPIVTWLRIRSEHPLTLERLFAEARKIFIHIKLIFMDTFTDADREEGTEAKAIESQTAKIPSDVFLWSPVASMTASLVLKVTGHKHTALFVGQWAAPFLMLGIYNKIVTTQGHDQVNS